MKYFLDEEKLELKSWILFKHKSNRSLLVSYDVQSFDLFIYNMWRNDNLGSYLIKYSRLYSTFPKAMNKLISTNERFFISLVGPSGSGKSPLIFGWLKIGTFGPGHKFKKKWTKNFLLEVLLDTKSPVWIIFLQTPKSLEYKQFYMSLLDLWNLLRKKDLGIVTLHLVSRVQTFLVTWLE